MVVGKLGHGDTERVYRPKVIESLVGLYIRKVVCASQYSLALTMSGQVSQPSVCIIPFCQYGTDVLSSCIV